MAEVLFLPLQPEGASHFGSSPLRRSSSQTSFFLSNPQSYPQSPSVPRSTASTASTTANYDARFSASVPSSAPSSPRLPNADFSEYPSYASTPSSSILEEECDFDEDDILFPSYNDKETESNSEDSDVYPDEVPDTSTMSTPSPKESQKDLSHLEVTELPITAGDDLAVRVEPSRHVDYLSHNWKEEDIWSSWRHIVAKRRVYGNSSRLENASWRTWAKSKNRLKTISPDALNWMKDHDVTWLYGPLQAGSSMTVGSDSAPPASNLSRSNSFVSKKPILKKRSLSEIMLQKSISSSTLMKQAVDALRAQQPNQRPTLAQRPYSDFSGTRSMEDTNGITTEPPSALHSASSSGATTPCGERRRIHFNDEVEQCIAIYKEQDDYLSAIVDSSDSDSDDGIVMMRAETGKERKLSNKSTPRGSFSNESKTIAMLPSTTLKYRADTPEPVEPPKPRVSFWNVAAKLARSASTETLKPSNPSSNFLLDDDDDEDLGWQPPPPRRDSMHIHRLDDFPLDEADEEISGRGLRRTPSGMFMPFEDDEDQNIDGGILGKVVDTVNTARDIAHVIWNVGWRR
ncbi:MAG: hypothetical protein MMC33_005848 [Icmadophila ericetorum]|nr:hypothetical protein [Icmadophila ericetorum]